MVLTYNGRPRTRRHTLGGYSQQIVVNERYVLRINHPEAQLAAVAPLLCAGITTYSPLRHWHAGPGKSRRRRHRRVGAYGDQVGPRHGAHVVAFTTSESSDAARALGADEVVVSRNEDEMAAHVKVSISSSTPWRRRNLDAFTTLLKRDGTMTGWRPGHAASIAGSVQSDLPPPLDCRLNDRRYPGNPGDARLLRRTRHRRRYRADSRRSDQRSRERMVKGDVKYRFVIDSSTLAD